MLSINSRVDGGRFLVVDVLGKGGSGIAYLALDTHSNTKHPKYYAIKCVPRPAGEADSSALMREIRLHKLVTAHPGIVTLKRCIQEGPYQLFIMDFMHGGDLFKQITQQHRYFQNDALITSVFLQIIDAVEYCHENGVYHRDLKPENILCNEDGSRVVLADFGLATRQTVSDDLGVGSGYYMSPECNSGPAYSTLSNDLWSLGVILCNLVFGRNPWAQAIPSDATFSAYVANPSYLSAILPASSDTARILTGPRGLFSLDPRKRMGLKELREEVNRVRRWVMSDDELRVASSEARSVAGVLRGAVRDREAKAAKLAAEAAHARAQEQHQHQHTAAAAASYIDSPATNIITIDSSSRHPHHHQHQHQHQHHQEHSSSARPQSTAAPPSAYTPTAHSHHRNSSLRLVLQKVAAPFRSTTPSIQDSSSTSSSSSPAAQYAASHRHSSLPHQHQHQHAGQYHTSLHHRRSSLAPSTYSSVSESQSAYSSSSSSDSLNSPMPLTPPASNYTSSNVDVMYGHHHHQWTAHGPSPLAEQQAQQVKFNEWGVPVPVPVGGAVAAGRV